MILLEIEAEIQNYIRAIIWETDCFTLASVHHILGSITTFLSIIQNVAQKWHGLVKSTSNSVLNFVRSLILLNLYDFFFSYFPYKEFMGRSMKTGSI